MKLLGPFLAALLLALASICVVVDAASLRATAWEGAEENVERHLLNDWKPPYWEAYEARFSNANFQRCTAFLEGRNILDPQSGTKCHKRTRVGDYTCMVGFRACESEVVTNTADHPTKMCRCDVATGLLTCTDWDACSGVEVDAPISFLDVSESTTTTATPPKPKWKPPTYWKAYRKAFPDRNFEPCGFLDIRGISVPVVDETRCHPRGDVDYTCAIGSQKCPEGMVGVIDSEEHPEITCKCDVSEGVFTECEKWKGCVTPEEKIEQSPLDQKSATIPDPSPEQVDQSPPAGATSEEPSPLIIACPIKPPEIGDSCEMDETEVCRYGSSQCACGDEKLKLFKCGQDGRIDKAEPPFLQACFSNCPEEDPNFPHKIEGTPCSESGGVGEDCTCNCGDVPCGPEYICDCTTDGTYSCAKTFSFRRTTSCACLEPPRNENGNLLHVRDPNAQCPSTPPEVDGSCDGLEGVRCGYNKICDTDTATYTCQYGKWLPKESWVPICSEPLKTCPEGKPSIGMPCEFADENLVCSYGVECGCGDDKPISLQCIHSTIHKEPEEPQDIMEIYDSLPCDTCPEDDPDFPWEIEGTPCTEGGGVGLECGCSCDAPCGPKYECACSTDGVYECVRQWAPMMVDCQCAHPPTDENGNLINLPDHNAVCPPTEPNPGEPCTGLYNHRCGYNEVCGTNTTTYDCNQWNGLWNEPRNWVAACPTAA